MLKTNLIRPIAVPTPMAETVDTRTARSPRWETHLSVRYSPGKNGEWGDLMIRVYWMRTTIQTNPK